MQSSGPQPPVARYASIELHRTGMLLTGDAAERWLTRRAACQSATYRPPKLCCSQLRLPPKPKPKRAPAPGRTGTAAVLLRPAPATKI